MRSLPPEYIEAARKAFAKTRPEDRPEGITRLKPHEGHYNSTPKGKD